MDQPAERVNGDGVNGVGHKGHGAGFGRNQSTV